MWGLGLVTIASVISVTMASSGARTRSRNNYDSATSLLNLERRDNQGDNQTRVRPRVPALVPGDTCPGVPGHNSARYPCPR